MIVILAWGVASRVRVGMGEDEEVFETAVETKRTGWVVALVCGDRAMRLRKRR